MGFTTHGPRTRAARRCARALSSTVLVAAVAAALAAPAQATDDPNATFTFLADGFTQELWTAAETYPVGIAFAKNQDVLTCYGGGHRFSAAGTSVAHGSTIHDETTFDSGCNGLGLANNPDGYVYNNAYDGVRRLDPDNDLALVGGPYGAPGAYTGIATDPQTGNLAYVASDNTIHWVNSAFTEHGVMSTNTTGHGLIDQIAFDPSGAYLFAAGLGDNTLIVLKRNGDLVQVIPMQHGPDGIAFHAAQPHFVATNNTDGTLSRFDFPGDDFTKPPTQSLLGSGAGYGDHTGVGADGCWYVSNSSTKYADGTFAGTGLVRICPGFAPQPGTPKRSGTFTCRASALRTGGALPVLEPQVANGPNGPCAAQDGKALGLLTLSAMSTTTGLDAPGNLPAAGDRAQAASTIAAVLPTLVGGHIISASSLSSTASVTCRQGADGLRAAFAGSSNVATVTIDGRTTTVNGTMTLNAGPVSVKIGATTTTAHEVVQRALEIDLNGTPVLVAAEARAGTTDTPCSAG